MQKHNLNLSPKYAPTWGAWEIAREFICNAIDADPDGYSTQSKGSDTLIIQTGTAPGLAELFMIGEGSKSGEDQNIGQFGEGAKIAALAATRGGSVEILIPGHKITFEFADVFNTPSLYAVIEASDHESGCKVTIKYPGIAAASMGKILGIRGDQPIPKGVESPMQIYCKGIWICEHKSNSLFDWNFDGLELNRDRSAIMGTSIRSHLAVSGIDAMSDDQILAVIKSDGNNEEAAAFEWTWNSATKQRIVSVFEAEYGSQTLISSNEENNEMLDERAEQQGHTVIKQSAAITSALAKVGVKKTNSVALVSDGLVAVDVEPHRKYLDMLRILDPIIGAPSFSISIFQVDQNKTMLGLADLSENRIWLSEQLFIEGSQSRIVQVYLHEVAHFLSGAIDGTRTFEDSLDWIAATFAMKFLAEDGS